MGESVLVELPLLNTQPVCLFTMKYVLLASGVTTAAFRPNAEHIRQSNKSVCFTRWDRFVLLINDKYEMVCLMTEGMSCIKQYGRYNLLAYNQFFSCKDTNVFSHRGKNVGKKWAGGAK